MIHEQTIRFGEEKADSPSAYMRAWLDFSGGVSAIALWGILGWQDIKQRYRRSVLGPFWLTISTTVMVGALSFLYAGLFKQPLEEYLPFVAVGMIVWTLISSILNESCTVFIAAEGMIKQIRLPLTVYVCRMVWRNVIIFAHNSIILVAIYFAYGKGWHVDILSLPLVLGVISINGIWVGILLGIFCTRFRDIAQIVANMVQLLFFVTPIMWRPEVLLDRGWVATYNPAFHFIELMRAPILGASFPTVSWMVVGGITMLGLAAALLALTRFRHRVAYWV